MRATFYYSDSHAKPPDALRFHLDISNEDGSTSSGDVLVSDHVGITDKTVTMAQGLVILRDAALVDAGYLDV